MTQFFALAPISMIVASVSLLILYGLGLAVYRVYFHPLAKYDATTLRRSVNVAS